MIVCVYIRSRTISLNYAGEVDMVDFPIEFLNGLDRFPRQLALFIVFREAQLKSLFTSNTTLTKSWIST